MVNVFYVPLDLTYLVILLVALLDIVLATGVALEVLDHGNPDVGAITAPWKAADRISYASLCIERLRIHVKALNIWVTAPCKATNFIDYVSLCIQRLRI